MSVEMNAMNKLLLSKIADDSLIGSTVYLVTNSRDSKYQIFAGSITSYQLYSNNWFIHAEYSFLGGTRELSHTANEFNNSVFFNHADAEAALAGLLSIEQSTNEISAMSDIILHFGASPTPEAANVLAKAFYDANYRDADIVRSETIKRFARDIFDTMDAKEHDGVAVDDSYICKCIIEEVAKSLGVDIEW